MGRISCEEAPQLVPAWRFPGSYEFVVSIQYMLKSRGEMLLIKTISL